ncbi:MAG TPA: hypothetical protein VNS79_02410 [Sphingobium sp.]|nr:hypothetical protein [Sphingobium sp.]
MQLFRQQAIDHQHRLYGEVLLVKPLRWSIILALFIVLFATVAVFLAGGRHSETITASGTSLSAERVALTVPASALASITVGQPVRLLQAAASGRGSDIFHAVIEHIPPAPSPNAPVTARLIRQTRQPASLLTPGAAIDARIVLASRPLLQWMISPHAGEAAP